MSRRRIETLTDALDLKRSCSEAELANLARVVGELQRASFTLTSTKIMRAMVRMFVKSQDAKNTAEKVSAVYDA